MNQQPDKLFREKLEGHQRPARTSAWDKLEAGLDKKSNQGLWLKIAASLFLGAVTTYSILLTTQLKSSEEKSQAKNKMTTPVPESSTGARDDNATVSNRVAKTDYNNEIGSKPALKRKNTPDVAVTQMHSEIVPVDGIEENPPNEDQSIQALPVVPVPSGSNEASVVAVAPSVRNEVQTITLVYTPEEVDEKYLDKKSLAEATARDKKSSRLKKLLNKASDLTLDQHPMGELRQKKDEILGLNFTRKNSVDKKDKPL